MTKITLYEYPKCSTCRKARNWLDENDVSYERVHLVEATPTASTLAALQERSSKPLKRFFNTSGKSYRSGGFSARIKEMSRDEKLAALEADGMLIKRPILDYGDGVLVGFKDAEYEDALG